MTDFQKRLSGRKSRARSGASSGSGKSIRLNQSLSDRLRASKQTRQMRHATYLSTLPKNPFLRVLYRLHPKRLADYWFSREGTIMGLKVVGIGIVVVFLLTIGVFAYFRKDLPNIKDISGDNLGGSITYYDRTGKTVLWQDYNAVQRIPVASNQISPYVKEATVAIEDKNFYHEGAFNLTAIIRAGLNDIVHHGAGLQGASTITEQVVKLNEEWIGQRTITIKIKELILAVELSREYSKDQILTAYLNIAPYGGIEYGVQAAAEDYFHTSAANLTLAQSAFLASIPQAPTAYSPYSSPQYNSSVTSNYFDEQGLIARKNYVLSQMASQGYITQAQAKQAQSVNILAQIQPLQDKFSGITAPYFVLTAKQQLENKYGAATVERGGWKVITTLSLPQQTEAQNLVASDYHNIVGDGGDDAAMVVENAPTGQVTALVGGVNFNNPVYGQLNFATNLISPGSTYKLYDYTAFINDNSAGAGSVLYDVQQPLPGYPCTNKALPLNGGNCLYDYDYQYPGPLTLRYALAGSRNVPAVKTMLITGEAKTIALSEAMGLTSGYNCYQGTSTTVTTTCYGSAAIGEGGYLRLNESVNGFATDARLGNYIPQTFILKIIDSSGNTIYNWTPPTPKQVVKPDAAYIIDNILSDPGASYLPGSCGPTNCTTIPQFGFKFQHTNGWDVAVKTGTTHDDWTGLMMGMTTQYVVGSWVGYHTATSPLIPHYGGLEGLTEPLTRGMITYLTQGQKPINWTPPPGIQTLPAYVINHPPAQVQGYYFGWEYPSPSTDIYPSWYTQPSSSNSTETIDKVSGGIATSCTPALARETLYGANPNIFSVDTFYPPNQSSTTRTAAPLAPDNVHHCSDTLPQISITQGATCEDSSHCDFTVTATQGTYPLSGGSYTTPPAGTLELISSGHIIATQAIPPNTSPYSFTFQDIPITNGQVIQAEVIDSVLYNSTASVTVNDTVPPPTTAPPTGTPPGNKNGNGPGNG